MKNKILLLTFFLAPLSFIFAPTIQAQSAMGTTAIPPRLEVTIKPGQVISQEIKIRNESKVVREYTTDVRDFIVSDEIGTPIEVSDIDETANRWAASTWVQVSPSKVTLKPGETKSLVLTVIAPNNATAGGHYAMVLHTPDVGPVSIDGSGAAVTTRVGTLLYVTVPGNVKEDTRIKEFSAPKFLEFGPVDFRTIITNYGDVHVLPVGAITVRDLFGLKVANIALPETRIFPLTDRIIDSQLNQKWLFGRFTAKLAATYGTSGQPLTAALSFWVIPYRLLVLLIAALIIIYVLITLVRHKAQTDFLSSESKVSELEEELNRLKKKYQDR